MSEPAPKRLLVAFSGGLDTTWLVARAVRTEGCDVTALTVDCGGFDGAGRAAVRARALEAGASEHRFVDAREELFERVLRWLIAGNVRRGGVYPLCVAAERGVQAEILARVARAEGFDAVAHGCTGAGNDQVRFEAALTIVGDGLTVRAPVRDLSPSRDEEVGDLAGWGIDVPASTGRFSINAGLWGLTIGGGPLLESAEPLPDDSWCWTRDARLDGSDRHLTVRFVDGVPVAIDGVPHEPVELIERLNREAGALGVGRGYHLGDTVLGIKGRIAFEAPAAAVLLDGHRELEKLVLTEEQRFWKDHLGDVYGRRLHQGLLHDPFLRDVEAFMASTQGRVTGDVRVHLRGGHVTVEGLDSPYSLMAVSDARYGERPAADADPAGPRWLARVLAEPARLAQRAGQVSHVHPPHALETTP